MFTCFQGGVGHTLLGSHLWKTLSGCFQLDRKMFTCFLHSIDWSSTYIKDLDRVDFISLGVSQHKSLIFTLTASHAHSWRAELSLLQRPDAKATPQSCPTGQTPCYQVGVLSRALFHPSNFFSSPSLFAEAQFHIVHSWKMDFLTSAPHARSALEHPQKQLILDI